MCGGGADDASARAAEPPSCKFEVCAAHSDELAQCHQDCAVAASDYWAGVVCAVRGLQDEGFNVILLVAASRHCEATERFSLEPGVDAGRLLFYRCCGPKRHVELIRVAEEYGCSFASNTDCDAGAGAGRSLPWERAADCYGSLLELPRPQRDWLAGAWPDLQVRYSFSAGAQPGDAAFAPQLPQAVRQHLAVKRHLKGGQATVGADAAEIAGAVAEGPAAGADAANEDPGHSPPPELAGPDPGVDLACAGVNACVIAVRRGARLEHLLCVHCEAVSLELFRVANVLAAELLGGLGSGSAGAGKMHENDSEDPELSEALTLRGGRWGWHHYVLLTTCRGRHAGLRGVGLGSTLKKRRRAAHLALAVTAALHGSKDASEGVFVGPPSLAELMSSTWQALHILCSKTS